MARGWESKSIEHQQDDARRKTAEASHPPLSESERERMRQRATLTLALTTTRAEIELATSDARRKMLHAQLEAIESRLAAL